MKRNLIIILIALLFLILSLSFAIAQNDSNNNSYFENVRGQLLSSYNSQIVSHAAIILGLIIAFGTIGKDAIKGIISNRRLFHVLGLESIASIIVLILYESGRLFYWSDASSTLISLNQSALLKTGVITNNTDLTAYMYLINNSSVTTVIKDNSTLTTRMGQIFNPNNSFFLIAVVVLLACLPIAIELFYCWRNKEPSKKVKRNHKS